MVFIFQLQAKYCTYLKCKWQPECSGCRVVIGNLIAALFIYAWASPCETQPWCCFFSRFLLEFVEINVCSWGNAKLICAHFDYPIERFLISICRIFEIQSITS